ncbi:acyl-CoA dehydrogenase family protein [Mameliella sediminis]|uniref:acyl-CoA dehydrogenase family protein n=1 Tax=Mameliella sediminis TaxID=2836866 RepID=UPI001C43F9B4|nr:acyl-CoA dehydrogenase family protein [Mameliella sediminis]MBV7396467.1 acyl-CoA dehydrogenase family protein [Mameliella sediminis]MBY6116812.1 acyl-CoA dehydrogenase family protein [Antarctobacter heliothermus]MBY6146565.1 acyl-CoA dehydrogenase family protein [Mameliella alba]MCA0956293.1 acyl-CoA dehydrogenase family protein [Mameliella alba]
MYLTDMHIQVRDMTRQFSREVIRPKAEELDRDERFPAEIFDQMAELGLFGVCVPDEMGGTGLDVTGYALVMEELSHGYSSVADQCGMVELICTLLAQHGDAEQRAAWLPDIMAARKRVAYCLTEAEAGSDLSSLRTTARRDGDGWVLNGGKLWIHNAPIADMGLVLARTDPEAGHRGMSIFIVDLNAPGVTRGPKEHKMGQRASQIGGLDFNEVKLPPEALLGTEGRGFHMMMSVLDKGRVGIAALAVGIAQAGLEASLEYAAQRKQFGQPVVEFQGVQWMLADMAKDIEAARLLTHSAAHKLDNGQDATRACSMAKCFAGDMVVQRTADAVQIFGGSGYIRGFEVERLYRDAKICQIYEGTNQVQRMIITREMLKKGVAA